MQQKARIIMEAKVYIETICRHFAKLEGITYSSPLDAMDVSIVAADNGKASVQFNFLDDDEENLTKVTDALKKLKIPYGTSEDSGYNNINIDVDYFAPINKYVLAESETPFISSIYRAVLWDFCGKFDKNLSVLTNIQAEEDRKEIAFFFKNDRSEKDYTKEIALLLNRMGFGKNIQLIENEASFQLYEGTYSDYNIKVIEPEKSIDALLALSEKSAHVVAKHLARIDKTLAIRAKKTVFFSNQDPDNVGPLKVAKRIEEDRIRARYIKALSKVTSTDASEIKELEELKKSPSARGRSPA